MTSISFADESICRQSGRLDCFSICRQSACPIQLFCRAQRMFPRLEKCKALPAHESISLYSHLISSICIREPRHCIPSSVLISTLTTHLDTCPEPRMDVAKPQQHLVSLLDPAATIATGSQGKAHHLFACAGEVTSSLAPANASDVRVLGKAAPQFLGTTARPE